MSIITFILSILLIGFGGYALYSGFDIVTTERGLALTLCGTMALSIGFAVLSLGFVLVQLKRIATNLTVQAEIEIDDVVLDGVSRSLQTAVLQNSITEADIAETHTTQVQPVTSPALTPSPIPVPQMSASPASRFAPISSSYKTIGTMAAGAGIGAGGVGAFAVGAGLVSQESEAKDQDAALKLDQTNKDVIDDLLADELNYLANADQETSLDEDKSFVDLDKLIDELAVETSTTAQISDIPKDALQAQIIQTEPIQAQNAFQDMLQDASGILPETAPLSAFEAELRAHDLSQDLEQDMLLEQEMLLEQDMFDDEASDNQTSHVTHVLPDDEFQDKLNDELSLAQSNAEIIGAYDSGGVTYTLYSDGGVVAQAGDIAEKYHSLEALKIALEDGSSAFKS
jgi:hypothetical protein